MFAILYLAILVVLIRIFYRSHSFNNLSYEIKKMYIKVAPYYLPDSRYQVLKSKKWDKKSRIQVLSKILTFCLSFFSLWNVWELQTPVSNENNTQLANIPAYHPTFSSHYIFSCSSAVFSRLCWKLESTKNDLEKGGKAEPQWPQLLRETW